VIKGVVFLVFDENTTYPSLHLTYKILWRSLQSSPDPPARFQGPTFKGREAKGRKGVAT